MIFTYSGTGNSEYAARALLDEGEALISIPRAVREGRWVWRCAEGERAFPPASAFSPSGTG